MVVAASPRFVARAALLLVVWLIDAPPATNQQTTTQQPPPPPPTTTTNDGLESVLKSNTFWDRHLFNAAAAAAAAADSLPPQSRDGQYYSSRRAAFLATGEGALPMEHNDESSNSLFALDNENNLVDEDELENDEDSLLGNTNTRKHQAPPVSQLAPERPHKHYSNLVVDQYSPPPPPHHHHHHNHHHHNIHRPQASHTRPPSYNFHPHHINHLHHPYLHNNNNNNNPRRHHQRHLRHNYDVGSQSAFNNEIVTHDTNTNEIVQHNNDKQRKHYHAMQQQLQGNNRNQPDASEKSRHRKGGYGADRSQQVPEQSPIVVSSSDNSYVSASPIVNPNNEMISTTATTTTDSSSITQTTIAEAEAYSVMSEKSSDQFRKGEVEEEGGGNTSFNARFKAAPRMNRNTVRNGQLDHHTKFNNLIDSSQRLGQPLESINGQQADKEPSDQQQTKFSIPNEQRKFHAPYDIGDADDSMRADSRIKGEIWHHVSEKSNLEQNSFDNENLIIGPQEMSPAYALPIDSDSEVVLVDDQAQSSLDSSTSSTNRMHYFNIVRQPHNVVPYGSNGRRFWSDSHLASIKIEQQETNGFERGSWVSSAIAILVGLSATGMLVLVVGHKMRSIKRKGRRRSLVPDTDFLINTIPI